MTMPIMCFKCRHPYLPLSIVADGICPRCHELDISQGKVVMNSLTPQPTTDLDIILTALRGDMRESQKRIAQVGLDWVATLIRKNSDYGNSAWEPPVLAEDLGSKAGILVRMSDKIKRLKQLRSNEALVKESYDDTIKDLGAYCLLYLAAPEETNEKQPINSSNNQTTT